MENHSAGYKSRQVAAWSQLVITPAVWCEGGHIWIARSSFGLPGTRDVETLVRSCRG